MDSSPLDDPDEGWPSAAERAASIARAKALRAQAAAGGLRFEAYLPPALATWLLDHVGAGMFLDPSEAVFVMLGEQQELEPHTDLRDELERRMVQAALDDPHPGIPAEEVFARLHERQVRPRLEPAEWPPHFRVEPAAHQDES